MEHECAENLCYIPGKQLNTPVKTALFIGRFQPMHNGHLQDIKDILKECKHIVIGIGSPQYRGTDDNPYDVALRKRMIKETLAHEFITDYEIVEIEDMHDDGQWLQWIMKNIKFDVAYSGNDWVIGIFEKEGIPVKRIKLTENISSTKIRELMKEKKEWKHMVPEAVVSVLHIDKQ